MLKEAFTRPLSASEITSQLIGGAVGLIFGISFASWSSHVPHLLEWVLLAWIPALLLHELAHAFTCLVAGGQVHCIKLGLNTQPVGKCFRFRFVFPWEIYSVPLSGSVFCLFTDPRRYRKQVAYMVVAGPLASLVAALSGLIPMLVDKRLAFSAPVAGWFLINLFFFCITAIPLHRRRKIRDSKTDGYRLWQLTRMTSADVMTQCVQSRLQLELTNGKQAAALLSIDETIYRYRADPDSIAFLLRLIDKLAAAKDPRLNSYISELISHPHGMPINYVRFLDGYLTRQLIEGTAADHPCFDQFSEKLVSVARDPFSARGTRGGILIDLGRIDEGRTMLNDVLLHSKSAPDRAYCHVFLALADGKLGNIKGAREHAEQAAQLDPKCPALARVTNSKVESVPNDGIS